MTAAVRIEGLTKRYGETLAVANVDLDIGVGEIFGLVGPNGAGKSTTLRMLATLLEPSGGEAQVWGLDIRRQPNSVRRVIGYMPDTFGVYDDMRVWEYLDFYARTYVIPANRRKQIVADLLDLVDLRAKSEAYVHALSRGMQQRLCLAHALVHDPKVLLLDEPASGLDPRARAELRELLRTLRSLGKTIVISSHILPELEELCTAVAIIDRGRVLASGSVDQIQSQFQRGTVVRARVVGGPDEWQAARSFFADQAGVVSVSEVSDGRVELAVSGDEKALAELLYRAMSSGHLISSFAPVVSDLEELFLQITAPPDQFGVPPS
ncbi:MAG: ABC transporter ATP-binding protein [Chloroflexota bacterium]